MTFKCKVTFRALTSKESPTKMTIATATLLSIGFQLFQLPSRVSEKYWTGVGPQSISKYQLISKEADKAAILVIIKLIAI